MPAGCGAVKLCGHRPAALFDAQSGHNLDQVGPGGHQPMGSLDVECAPARVDGLDPFPTQLVDQRQFDLALTRTNGASETVKLAGAAVSRVIASAQSPLSRAAPTIR
jgi:hypothetical protein